MLKTKVECWKRMLNGWMLNVECWMFNVECWKQMLNVEDECCSTRFTIN